MTRIACRRTWQVEAARDGRLAGSDLSNALRHRSECADCKQAARELDELGRRVKALPAPKLDEMVHRRGRQTLLAAWNAELLTEPRARVKPVVLLVAALCVIGSAALAAGYRAAGGVARGSDVTVPAQCAGLATGPKEKESAPVATSEASTLPRSSAMAPEAAMPPSTASAHTRAARRRLTGAIDSTSETAEDDAYLQIVELLRQGREREARAKAAQYLRNFPHGFRRPEVAKIAER